MPLAELQSIWVSKYLCGEYELPTRDQMLADIQQEREVMRKRYGNSARHTIQVDFEPYIRSIYKEMKQGKQRQPRHEALITSQKQEAVNAEA